MPARKPTPTRRSTVRTVAPPSLGERLGAGALRLTGSVGALLARDPAVTLGIAAFGLFTAVVATNAVTAQPGRHPQPMFSTRGAAPGGAAATDADPMIRTVQEGLIKTGHYRAAVDGKAGPATVEAIKAFQGEWGLEPTGKATPALDVAIDNAAAVAVPGSVTGGARVASLADRRGASDAAPAPAAAPARAAAAIPADLPETEIVRRIQAGLSNAQVATLTADGIAGPATRRAVEAFQALEGMDVTGKPDRTVLQRLVDIGAAN
jgi:peptidoglycan hydrolase-like protein with peptidoglycan-binding domain